MANNSILSEVYSYYPNSYFRKPSTKFDAHKRSELKNLYNSIVNTSKEEPVFLLRNSRDIQQYTISMKEGAISFRDSIASLGGQNGEALFSQRTVYSSDTNIAEVNYLTSNASDFATDEETIALSIEKLAKPQINHGKYVVSDILGLEPGTYSFDVETRDTNYELQLDITDKDTNKSIEKRLARLLNNSTIGLKARVSNNDSDMSALIIESISTGLGNDNEQPFKISDNNTSKKRGLVNYFGLKNVSQTASWAKYSVDGVSYTSPDNNINLANRYMVKMKDCTQDGQSVIIGTKPDYDSLIDSVNGIANSYNKFIEVASNYLDKQPRTSVLISSMKRMTNLYSKQMNMIGMKQEDNGTLSVDSDMLAASLQNNDSSEILTSLKDFTKVASRKIKQVQLNPMDYVDKPIVAYKNPTKTHFANPYVTSAYSGMIFNSYM